MKSINKIEMNKLELEVTPPCQMSLAEVKLQINQSEQCFDLGEYVSEEEMKLFLDSLDSIPCRFSEEELDEVIKHSEASGNASEEEVQAFFAKRGH